MTMKSTPGNVLSSIALELKLLQLKVYERKYDDYYRCFVFDLSMTHQSLLRMVNEARLREKKRSGRNGTNC